MRFPETYKVVPVANNLDVGAGAGSYYSDSINMKGFHRATFLIAIHDDLATATPVLTVQSGTADATYDSALYFNYAFATAAELGTDADVLNIPTTPNVNTLSITHGTYPSFMLIVEVDASAMDIANGEEWLALKFTDPGTADGTICAFAILEPRYTKSASLTSLE